MLCLRSLLEVSRIDRVRNEEVSRRAKIERELTSRVNKRVCDVERMNEYRMARWLLIVEIIRERVRGRPRFVWMDGVR